MNIEEKGEAEAEAASDRDGMDHEDTGGAD